VTPARPDLLYLETRTRPRSVPKPTTPPSLNERLLVALALLATAALLVAMSSVLLYGMMPDEPWGPALLVGLVTADTCVFVLFGAVQLRRLVLRPLEDAVAAAEAIAAGDLKRRVPEGATQEFAALAASVNRMTDHLLAAHVQRVRDEKLASVGRLAAGIAHEIGNPLGAINGYVHILAGHTRGDRGAAEAVEGIDRESGRIDRIVRGLLDYARPRRVTPTRVDLNDVVRFAVRLLGDQGRLRGITVTTALDARGPAVFGERHELEQVLVNLLLNATDAAAECPAGAGEGTKPRAGHVAVRTLRVRRADLEQGGVRRAGDSSEVAKPRKPLARVEQWLARVQPGDEVVKVVVSDSGPGVDESDVERIFDPFYTTKAPGKGTGLGLAIVVRIVESLQGTVWVERAREGGAAFHMLFPLAVESGARPARPIRPTPSRRRTGGTAIVAR
jgi:signal transduction histidine kinase